MYKSSSISSIFKYAPLVIIVVVFLTYGIQTDRKIIELALILLGLACWAFFFMKRLKFATTRHDCIVIGSLNENKSIEYSSIQWIYQSIFMMPYFISINYIDSKSGKIRNILILPSMSEEWFSFDYFITKETEMVKFIRKKTIEENLKYEQNNEPSRLLPLGWWIGTMVIIFGLVPLIEFLFAMTN